tara:strand:- start:295 stop:762 length:468 start_codon:yes stop_codon:yes gene_type:complete
MKFLLLNVGKTNTKNIDSAIIEYHKKIQHYINFDIKNLIIKKNNSQKDKVKKIESDAIKKIINKNDYVILLDTTGSSFNSVDFSKKVSKLMISSVKRVVFITGGAFGFNDDIYDIANEKISLSQMTFTHQMVRLIFVEQLYRSFTILNNQPYHHN